MTLVIFLLASLALWLSVCSLKIALRREQPPASLKCLSPQFFGVMCVTLASISLWALCLSLPVLQGVFTWLGAISLCGISAVVANPSLRADQ